MHHTLPAHFRADCGTDCGTDNGTDNGTVHLTAWDLDSLPRLYRGTPEKLCPSSPQNLSAEFPPPHTEGYRENASRAPFIGTVVKFSPHTEEPPKNLARALYVYRLGTHTEDESRNTRARVSQKPPLHTEECRKTFTELI